MKPDDIRKLKRGMLIQYPDGRIERVLQTFRGPAFQRKGVKMFIDSAYTWATAYYNDIKILGFVKP